MKALICTDLEGTSGVISFEEQCVPAGKYYGQAKNLLTGEVNAAIEGLLEENILEILVFDGHGTGSINIEKLHPAARLFHGRPLAGPRVWREMFTGYDFTMMIGQHSMAGTIGGCLSHTQCEKTVLWYKLNGRFIGEIAQWMLFCGALNIPLIFLSGDVAACNEAQQLIPHITTVPVKEGINNTSAISLQPQEACNRIVKGIKCAVEAHGKNPKAPFKWESPYVLEICFLNTDRADIYQKNPLAERLNANTVRLESDDILEIIYA